MNITLAGLGVKKCQQLTIECLEAVRKADWCLFLSPDAKEFIPFLKQYGVGCVENIFHLYHDGDVDQNNYDRIFDHIVSRCTQHQNIILLMPGHPLVGVTVAQMIKAAQGDIFNSVTIQPGISSFDAMISDLSIDPLEKGCVLIDANRLLLLNLPLSPLLNVFLYHVCSVGTRYTHIHDSSKGNRLDQLQAYLQKFYSYDHPIILLYSTNDENEASVMNEFPLSKLNDKINDVHIGTTLVIPASKLALSDVDPDYLMQLRGVAQ